MAVTKAQWEELVDTVGKMFRTGKNPEEIAQALQLKVSLIRWIIHDNDRFQE